MNLSGRADLAVNLSSRSQIARVVTEDWCEREMYCPGCEGDRLERTKPGSPTCDFVCIHCEERFEVKSGLHRFGTRIPDSAYGSMIAAIREDRTPNLIALQYSATYGVSNLFIVPRYFITESVIEKRPPLAPHARRAGWIGCNILLSRIPTDGRIHVVKDGVAVNCSAVRNTFRQSMRLRSLTPENRGWTVDVLQIVRSLAGSEFSLSDMYAFEHHLAALHPQNRHVRPKIRQQLQVLRDLGFLEFVAPGRYRIAESK